jgi:HEAT repeat protein
MTLVWALQGSRDKTAIATLVECLRHKDQYVRWAAVEGLARRRQTSVLKPLLAALSDRSDLVRFSALRAIAKVADQTAIEPLRHFLGRKKLNPGAKKLAEELLARLERVG